MSATIVALTELIGRPVRDAAGRVAGRVADLLLLPHEHSSRVASFVVRTGTADRLVPTGDIAPLSGPSLYASSDSTTWAAADVDGLLLKRDLLDQQIIDVHGRKVVRVNDVELEVRPANHHVELSLLGVDVGARGALRRLAKGIVPSRTLRALLQKMPPRVIPWHFVDLIEADPKRRVKLRIAYEGLAGLHPADIADIVEELPQAERHAIFAALDDTVAAEALEELDPKLQVAVVESLDSDRAADIVEEMNPDAAADLLADLPEEGRGTILGRMALKERLEISHLLEFGERTAAGRMTTEFFAVPETATVGETTASMRGYEGALETLATVYLTGPDRDLRASVPLARLIVATPETPVRSLASSPLVFCPADASDRDIVELFDKYNLLTLPVVDEHHRLSGVITADDVICLLHHRH